MVYLGSKNKIAKYIVPILQNIIDKNKYELYIEPFVGGGNIIDKINCFSKLGYDINEDLITLHRAVQNYTKDFAYDFYWKLCDELNKQENKEQNKKQWLFYKNQTSSSVIKAFYGFIASYNGRYFDSFVLTNNGRNYIKERFSNLIKQSQSELYRKVIFTSTDYKQLVKTHLSSCHALWYCDVPYHGTKDYGTNFNFDEFEQWCEKISSNNNTIIISEIRDLDSSKWKLIWSEYYTYTHGGVKKKVKEKLYEYTNKFM